MNKKKTHISTKVKAAAREQLLGKYTTVVFAYLVSDFIISSIAGISRLQVNFSKPSSIIFFVLLQLILTMLAGIFLVGQNYMHLKISRNEPVAPSDIWHGFVKCPDKILRIEGILLINILLRAIPLFISIGLYYVLNLKIMIAVSILVGIFFLLNAAVIQLSYMPALFLVLEDENAGIRQIMEASALLMIGHRLEYVRLALSFIGLYFLSLISFGLGFLWVVPYFYASRANFYNRLLKNYKRSLSAG